MAMQNRVNNKKAVFSEVTFHKISRILQELNTRLKSNCCVFADINGYPIDYSGDVSHFNMNSLTAVAAGSFTASHEMARIISGEKHFQHIFLEGVRRNVYMCNVSSDYLMIIIFEKSVPVGLVRLLTHHAVAKLGQYLESLREGQSKISEFLDRKFKSQLENQLNNTLGNR